MAVIYGFILGFPGQDAVQLLTCCEPKNKPLDDMRGG